MDGKVLDEISGIFINNSTVLEYDEKSDFADDKNYILDEKTGRFVAINNECPQQDYDVDFDDFSTSNDLYFSDSEVDCFGAQLDTSTGIVTKTNRKKGQSEPNKWERNRIKKARMTGKEYCSKQVVKGKEAGKKIREKKQLQPLCDLKKCKKAKHLKCNELKSFQRQEIFNNFWTRTTWSQRKVLISSLVKKVPVKRRKQKEDVSRRRFTFQYSLKIDGEVVPVCKKTFLNTFCLKEWSVRNWVLNNDNYNIPTKKSKGTAKHVLSKRDSAKKFILSLPKIESHYCRKDSNKEYFDITYQSIREIYSKYEDYMKSKDVKNKASYHTFLKVIHSLNVGLYKPKKDQCDLCFSYKKNNIDELSYKAHLNEKDEARAEKAKDKTEAMKGERNVYTLDVQAVQLVPQIEAGAIYFKQKLAVHQFTIYNLKTSETHCYVWHEGEGGMDANVFASCVANFLENYVDLSLPTVLFSDGCGAQNRNTTLANTLQLIAIKYNATLFQKYLTVGHTQMECDAVHALIEKKKKCKELFVPMDFVNVIKKARSVPEPYNVHYIDHNFFKNYSQIKFYKSIRPGLKTGDPQVIDIKCLKYDNSGMYFKLNYKEEWILSPQRKLKYDIKKTILPLYENPLEIKKKKYNDLQTLKKVIPQEYWDFFDNLKFIEDS